MQRKFKLSNHATKRLGVLFPILLAALLTSDAQPLWESVHIPGRVPVWQIVRCADVYVLKAETGLYRSVDQGQTWEFCAATTPGDGQLAAVGDTVLYHANPGHGLFASTNAGASWQMIWPSVPESAAGLTADETYVYYSTAYGIYRYLKNGGGLASALHFPLYQQFANVKIADSILWASSNTMLYKSVNRGANWTVAAEIPNLRCFHPHGNTVLAATGDALLRSDDGGLTWATLDNFPDGVQQLDWQDGCWLALCSETPVLWSADDGQNWWPPATGPFPNYGATGAVKNGLLWLLTSHLGGVFRSPNNGEFWVASTTGLQSPPAYPAEWLDRAGDFLMFNIGFTHLSVDGGDTWFMPLPTSIYDPFNHVVRHKGHYFALSLWGNIFQQEDGNPFSWVQRSSGYLYNSTFGYAPNTRLHDLGDRMAVTGKYAEPGIVFQSTNNGQSWPPVGNLPPGAFSVEAFDGQLYCLTSGGACLASSDVGATWGESNEGLPTNWGISARLCIRSGLLFFLDETRVFARMETGQPFSQISMPAEATGRVWDVDAENGQLMVATDAGVFSTSDWGTTWVLLSESLDEQDFSNAHIRLHQGSVFLLLPCSPNPLWKYVLPITGTAEISDSNTLFVSPNPLPDGALLTLHAQESFFGKNKNISVQIFDTQGEIALLRNMAALLPGGEIALGEIALRPGIYFVQVCQSGKVARCAIVKI